jgi:hypothetical protein
MARLAPASQLIKQLFCMNDQLFCTHTMRVVTLVLACFPACRSPDGAPPTPPSAPPESPSAGAASASPSAAPAVPSSSPGPAANGWSFDSEGTGAPPSGFTFGRTGSGRPGAWKVQAADDAPTKPNVLAQGDADSTSNRFPLAIAPVSLRDVDLSVRCKMISGKVDQACGLVFRVRDENNYYVTRANALEDNIRLYTVKAGARDQIASHSTKVTPNTWHTYRVRAVGDHIEVFWDGQKVLDHRDATFGGAGGVGVWTKADSVTHFDDLRAEPLP